MRDTVPPPYPDHFQHQVRELRDLFARAKLLRKDAVYNEFRKFPPLRPFLDEARLGLRLPLISPAAWAAFLQNVAVDAIGLRLHERYTAVVKYEARVKQILKRRAEMDERHDRLRNEWVARQDSFEPADTLEDQSRDMQVLRAYLAYNQERRERDAAASELETRFGALRVVGESSSEPLPELPERDLEDFFEEALSNEFASDYTLLERDEAAMTAEWEREFDAELAPMRESMLGPWSQLKGTPIDAMPHPWLGHARVLYREQEMSLVHSTVKQQARELARKLEIQKYIVRRTELRALFAFSARQYKELDDLATRNDATAEAVERRDRYRSETLTPIRTRYEDVLAHAMRHQIPGAYASMDLIEADLDSDMQDPITNEELVNLNRRKQSAQRKRLATTAELTNLMEVRGPFIILHDAQANRFLEASTVRNAYDVAKAAESSAPMENLAATVSETLIRLVVDAPWYDRNHRGDAGFDEAVERTSRWVDTLMLQGGVDTARPMQDLRAQIDDNAVDFNRPHLPHPTASLAPLPTLAAAAKVAMSALWRRSLVAVR